MSAIKKCAEMLRREAGSMKACHTLDGDWRGDPAEADYHEMIGAADAAIAERDELRATVRHEADCVEAAKAEIVTLRAQVERMEKQEPVASIYIDGKGDREFDDWKSDLPVGSNLLYTLPGAQPAPSIPPELEPNGMYDGSHHYASGWNDCREEMLAAAPKPEGE